MIQNINKHISKTDPQGNKRLKTTETEAKRAVEVNKTQTATDQAKKQQNWHEKCKTKSERELDL